MEKRSEKRVLSEFEAQKICSQYQIRTPRTALAKTEEECVEKCNDMGYPVVIKIVSKQIVHKSDVGGVAVGIKNEKGLGEAYKEMMERVGLKCPDAVIDGVLIQQMLSGGVEVVVGGLKNQQFGPVVMFGLGGIYIEVFKDVEFRLAPVSRAEARRQIEATKVYKLLQGVRGQLPCDMDALSGVITGVGQMLLDHPEISEIDFNPILCYPDKCVAVDARIVVES